MNITFNKVTPAPLAGVTDINTEIWNTNITFTEGKSYKIYAPSGKGKSTFIHAIYGLRSDYEGDILLDNQEAKSLSFTSWASLRTNTFSIVFQDLRLFPSLTGLENLAVKSSLYQHNAQHEIDEMIDFLQLKHIQNKKAATMSYGERQRFAIIRALIQPSKWLLLDEPFSHLDAENTRRACTLIEKYKTKYQTGLLMTSLGPDYQINFDHTIQL